MYSIWGRELKTECSVVEAHILENDCLILLEANVVDRLKRDITLKIVYKNGSRTTMFEIPASLETTVATVCKKVGKQVDRDNDMVCLWLPRGFF